MAVPPLLMAAVACTPTLNWREVSLANLTTFVPCKPDQAQRTVHLGDADVAMEMAGCEAADALYAVSHVRAPDAKQAPMVLHDWRAATLANLQATSVQPHDFKLAKAPDGAYQVPVAATATAANGGWTMLWVQGQRADASVVHARLVWFAVGVDIYHVAVYGAHLSPDTVDMLFSDLRLQ